MDTLRSIESFVRAVENGSIAAGARQMGITAAAASQNIQRLETTLGIRLLSRSTRSMALTDAGRIYYVGVKDILRNLELAKSSITEFQGEPQGRLRIACSAAFGRNVIADLIPPFMRRYPHISVELINTDNAIDHITENIDISIRFKQQLEPGMIARHIARVPILFCASPAYLDRAGRPTQPEALASHACLMFRVPASGLILGWGFIRDGLRFEPEITATVTSNDIDALARLAVGGAGIARLGAFVAQPLIESGQLEALFTGQADTEGAVTADIEPLDFYVSYQDKHAMTHKLRGFVDYLVEVMPREWKI